MPRPVRRHHTSLAAHGGDHDTPSTRADLHQTITDKIIAAIEKGADQWTMPWHRPGANLSFPKNALTGATYQGSNILSLWIDTAENGYTTPFWATYRQWQELGAQVRRGEKSSLIVKYGEWYPRQADQSARPDDADAEDDGKRLYAKPAHVFNANQVDGFTLPETSPRPDLTETLRDVEDFIAATGAQISHGGPAAFYRHPPADLIVLPDRNAFVPTATSSATENYYSTKCHELVHWTGAPHRLDRRKGTFFGDESYAREELVAEIGSGFLCAELGISPTLREDHVQYIAHWLSILKSDNRAIFAAASQASKAVSYLKTLQPKTEASFANV